MIYRGRGIIVSVLGKISKKKLIFYTKLETTQSGDENVGLGQVIRSMRNNFF